MLGLRLVVAASRAEGSWSRTRSELGCFTRELRGGSEGAFRGTEADRAAHETLHGPVSLSIADGVRKSTIRFCCKW
jgi:hypothetical protein